MEKFNQLSSPLKSLIDRVVDRAMDMVYEMTAESEFEQLNLIQFRNMVSINAIDAMAIEMDPENGNAVVPFFLAECIKERVKNNVNFKAVFE